MVFLRHFTAVACVLLASCGRHESVPEELAFPIPQPVNLASEDVYALEFAINYVINYEKFKRWNSFYGSDSGNLLIVSAGRDIDWPGEFAPKIFGYNVLKEEELKGVDVCFAFDVVELEKCESGNIITLMNYNAKGRNCIGGGHVEVRVIALDDGEMMCELIRAHDL